MRESRDAKRARARKIIRALKKAYPDAKIALNFGNPLELLVATILSAQCTDERVNLVTPALFKKYAAASDYARAEPATLEEEVRSTGFYRAKTRSIIAMAKALLDHHDGEVPRSREALVALPGVGLKTANVILGNAFGGAGHRGRHARLPGLTTPGARALGRPGRDPRSARGRTSRKGMDVHHAPRTGARPAVLLRAKAAVPRLSGAHALPLARQDQESLTAPCFSLRVWRCVFPVWTPT